MQRYCLLLVLALTVLCGKAFAQGSSNVWVDITLCSETSNYTTSKPLIFCKQTNTIYYWNGSAWAAFSSGAAAMPPVTLRPQQNEPPSTNAAAADTRNGHPILSFDGTVDEDAIFTSALPSTYAGNGLTVTLTFACASATSGTFSFQAAIERFDTATDIDADSFAAYQSGNGTCPATSGFLTPVIITFTNGAQMDSLAAGEGFRIKVHRTTDAVTTDVSLVVMTIKET